MSDLLLASGSSRRKELLDQIGVQFQSASMDIDESVLEGEPPANYVRRLAEEKALAGLNAHPDKVILAADTTVVLGEEILGKPVSAAAAKSMLAQLSGSTHLVLTGIAIARKVNGTLQLESQVVETKVSFLALSEVQIAWYVATGDPMDKAGAYGIQGQAAVFVDSIHGSYSNVVGLPLAETARLLQQFGVQVWND